MTSPSVSAQGVEEQLIDVRDLDTEWFLGVKVYLDRTGDRHLFPEESIARLGEAEPDDGTYLLLDGQVVAEPDALDTGDATVPVWSVHIAQLVTRPAGRV